MYITKSKSNESYFSGMIVTAPDVVLTKCWFGPRVKFVAAHCVNCEQGVRMPSQAQPQDVPLQDGYVTLDRRTQEEKSALSFDEQKAFVIKERLRQKAEKKAEEEQERHTVVDSSDVFIDAPGTNVTVTQGQDVCIRVNRRYSPYTRRSPSPPSARSFIVRSESEQRSPPSAHSFIVRTERHGSSTHTHTTVCSGTGISMCNVHNVNIDIRK